jgi:hypothetical protein
LVWVEAVEVRAFIAWVREKAERGRGAGFARVGRSGWTGGEASLFSVGEMGGIWWRKNG